MAGIGQSAAEAPQAAASHLQIAAIHYALASPQRDGGRSQQPQSPPSSDDSFGKTEAARFDAE